MKTPLNASAPVRFWMSRTIGMSPSLATPTPDSIETIPVPCRSPIEGRLSWPLHTSRAALPVAQEPSLARSSLAAPTPRIDAERLATSVQTWILIYVRAAPMYIRADEALRVVQVLVVLPVRRTRLGKRVRRSSLRVLPQKGDRNWPRPLGRPQVGPALRVLRAQEAVPGAFEHVRLVDL